MDPTPDAPRRPGKPRGPVFRLMIVFCLGAVVAAAAGGWRLLHDNEWQRQGGPITVHAWAPYWQPESAFASFNDNKDVFSDLSLFSFHATAADVVVPYVGFDPNVGLLFREATRNAGVKLTASIIDDTGKGAMAAILADPVTRSLHVNTIVQFAMAGGFDGIDLDYENFAFLDGRDTWATTRPNWVSFVHELADALHGQNKTLAVSIPPVYDGERTDDSGYWVYDYQAIGEVVDFIRVMAYDYSTSTPGPIAPLPWVTDLVAAIKELVPARKLILGVPVYGYDWVDSVVGTCPGGEADQPRRRNRSTKSATEDAAARGIVPTFDPLVAESTFTYSEQLTGVDPVGTAVVCTVNRTVWYADSRAVHARAWLAESEDLAGISLWSLGSDDAFVWDAIDAARADIAVWPELAPS